jgi:2-amino-4-hydroxy-6-hydroxymethyldihydropteridine diphosphokinase
MNDRAGLQHYAFVGLGANLPFGASSPVDTLNEVLPELARLSDGPLLVSRYFESEPKDCPPGSPRYVNAVAGLVPEPDESPESLLAKLQDLENRFGRFRSGMVNESRTLDLDLLAFGNEIRNTTTLALPHPRAHFRRFVLTPWCEIAGPGYRLQEADLGYWLAINTDPPLVPVSGD